MMLLPEVMVHPSMTICIQAYKFRQNLVEILFRFLIHNTALGDDIEKAFFMVAVALEDKNFLKFLCVHDITRNTQRFNFCLQVWSLEFKPLPTHATFKHHIEQYRQEDPEFLKSIYIDHLSSGAADEDSAYEDSG